ncbi:hypothetical protein [Tichowtungia aerotolerans]|uniref:hypothetical protein n=1 Tax=Tichowtungia aerotolerans TaxID=2697043 RepID=UPI0038CD79D7
MGCHYSGSSWFDGSIDEFHIYNRKLNAGEINDLYSGTTTCSQSPEDVSKRALTFFSHWYTTGA